MSKHRDRGPPTDDPSRTNGRVDDPDLQELLDQARIRAAREGDYEKAREALAGGADVHYWNEGPLCEAAAYGHTEIVRLLAQAGSDVSVHEHGPLRGAEERGDTATARVLREYGSYNPRVPGEDERTLPERSAWREIREGSTESFQSLRDRYQRYLDRRRQLLKNDPKP